MNTKISKSIILSLIATVLVAIHINAKQRDAILDMEVTSSPVSLGSFKTPEGLVAKSHIEAEAIYPANEVWYTLSYSLDGEKSNIITKSSRNLQVLRDHHKHVVEQLGKERGMQDM